MAHTRRTLELTKDWDITLTPSGGLALAGGAQATAQNVANEARLFIGDAYFVQDKGLPHFSTELGQPVSQSSILRAQLSRAAGRVKDVARVLDINVEDFNPVSRTLSGSIRFNTAEDSANEQVTYF
jgi:hypothetical protein